MSKWKPYTVTWERLERAGHTIREVPSGLLYPEAGLGYTWACSEAQAIVRVRERLKALYQGELFLVEVTAYLDWSALSFLRSKKLRRKEPQHASPMPAQGDLFLKAPR